MSTNKLGADVGYHTRSMSKKADGKPSDTLNILTRSTTKSTEIYASPKHKPKDNVETGSEKKRPSTPRSCKKSITFREESPGPLTRGKRKSLSVKSSVKNIFDNLGEKQPKDCQKLNISTNKNVDIEESIDLSRKAKVLSDNNNIKATNINDLEKSRTNSCKNLRVVLRRTPEMEDYCDLDTNKCDNSEETTDADLNSSHNSSKENIEDMIENAPQSSDVKKSNIGTVKKSLKDDLKSVSPSKVVKHKDIACSDNSAKINNSEELKAVHSPRKLTKISEKQGETETKKTDDIIENTDNNEVRSVQVSPKLGSIKKTDCEKPSSSTQSPSVQKKLESPTEKSSLALGKDKKLLKSIGECSLEPNKNKEDTLIATNKKECLTENPISDEKENNYQESCDDSEIMSPQEFLKDFFNSTEENLLESKKIIAKENENLITSENSKKNQSNIVKETTKSFNSPSTDIEAKENNSQSKTDNTVVLDHNKLINDSATNKEEMEKQNELQEKVESLVEKKIDEKVTHVSFSPRKYTEPQKEILENKRASIETDADVLSADNASDISLSDNVPKSKLLSIPEELPESAKLSVKQDKDVEIMNQANSTPDTFGKKKLSSPTTEELTSETMLDEENERNKMVTDVNEIQAPENLTQNEKVGNKVPKATPNKSIPIIDVEEDSRMSGVEEIPEIEIQDSKSVNKEVQDESSSEIVSSGTNLGEVSYEANSITEDIPVSDDRKTFGKRSMDEVNDVLTSEEEISKCASKKKKLECTEKENSAENISDQDNENKSFGDENVSEKDRNDKGENDEKIVNENNRSSEINEQVLSSEVLLAKKTKKVEEVPVESSKVVVISSEPEQKKPVESSKVVVISSEPEQKKAVSEIDIHAGAIEGEQGNNTGKENLDGNEVSPKPKKGEEVPVEGSKVVDESSKPEQKKSVSEKKILDDREDEEEDDKADEESLELNDKDLSSKMFLADKPKKVEDKIVEKDETDKSSESDKDYLVTGKDFLDYEAEDEEEDDKADEESLDLNDKDLSSKTFLADKAKRVKDRTVEKDVTDESSESDKDDLVTGKDFLDDEAEEDESDDIADEESLDLNDKDLSSKTFLADKAKRVKGRTVEKDVTDESSESDKDDLVTGKDFLDVEAEESELNKSSESSEDENIISEKAPCEVDEGEEDDSSDSDSKFQDCLTKGSNEENDGGIVKEVLVEENSDTSDSSIVLPKKTSLDDIDEDSEEKGTKEVDEETDASENKNADSDENSGGSVSDKDIEEDDESSHIVSAKYFFDDEAEEDVLAKIDREDESVDDASSESDDASSESDDAINKYFHEYEEEFAAEGTDKTKSASSDNAEENLIVGKKKGRKLIVDSENSSENDLVVKEDEDKLSSNSGETESNEEFTVDNSEDDQRVPFIKTKISKNKSKSHTSPPNKIGSWIVSNVPETSKIKQVSTKNLKFSATKETSTKKLSEMSTMSQNSSRSSKNQRQIDNWSVSKIVEVKGNLPNKNLTKQLNPQKRKLESKTTKEPTSTTSKKLPTIEEDLLEQPELYDSLLLKRKRSKKRCKNDYPTEEDSLLENAENSGSQEIVEEGKSLGVKEVSSESNMASKFSKKVLSLPEMDDPVEQDEEMRNSLKRFTDAIDIYKKKLKGTHKQEEVVNSLKNVVEESNEDKSNCPFRIIVGNVPSGISASDVKNVFSKVGLNDIANVSPVMENAEMPFTTVTFSSKKSQQRALEFYGLIHFKGNPLFPLEYPKQDQPENSEESDNKSNQDHSSKLQNLGSIQTTCREIDVGFQNKESLNLANLAGKSLKKKKKDENLNQNRNQAQSTSHLSKQKSSTQLKKNKTEDCNQQRPGKQKLKNKDFLASKNEEENPSDNKKICKDNYWAAKTSAIQSYSVNIKSLSTIRPTIEEIRKAFSLIGVTDVKSLDQLSKKVTTVKLGSDESVKKLLSYTGKIEINGIPILVKQKDYPSLPEIPSSSTANLENNMVVKTVRKHHTTKVTDEKQSRDSTKERQPKKQFVLKLKNIPSNSSETNLKKSLIKLGIQGILKVKINRNEARVDKIIGIVYFFNEKFYLKALNMRNILFNESQLEFVKIDKKD
ncbi:uncharacterized protein isoform X2 [Rhodnius prolixus]|uniref:uncharacterized protein isoform X2 n=1 Tax=Rhodnius prolixus TaxID=13249 RepID=UPI003D18E314